MVKTLTLPIELRTNVREFLHSPFSIFHTFFLSLLVLVAGCPPPLPPPPLNPLPIGKAIEIINENAAQLSTGLKATGPVRGQFLTAEGQTRSFDLNGKLLVIPPRHLRLDVQNALGRTELLLGSNAEHFWLHVGRNDDTFRFGRHSTLDSERAIELPIRPDWIIEALGLGTLPTNTIGATGPVQIIEQDRQRLLFISYDNRGQGMVRKEYWLSRHKPRLIERVVFRDEIGTELMHSRLSDYRRLDETGPMLPRRVRVEWPMKDSWIELRVRRWQERSELATDHPAFALPAPKTLQERYRRVIDIDSGHVLGTAPPVEAEHSP